MQTVTDMARKRLPRPMVNLARRNLQRVRSLDASRRALPNFVILGVQKGGTTSLYRYICEHPQVEPALHKEVQYYTKHYDKGETWYRSNFPYQSQLKARHAITGEATPYYIFHPHVLRRIQVTTPQAKLIVVLRNPIERAISHYHFEVRLGHEDLPLEEAFHREETRIGAEYQRMLDDETFVGFAYQHFSYKRRGIYFDQIKPYYDAFGAGQIMVVHSEDLFNGSARTIADVYAFLGVDPAFVPANLAARNAGRYSVDISADLQQHLVDYFAPHNARLYDFLQRDLGW